MAAEAPEWLRAAFPGHQWQQVLRVPLKVLPQGGAGLQLEATEFGYLLEGVDDGAGQDARLQAGSTIVAIDGVPLLSLDEDALDEVFGRHFCDGAELQLLATAELRVAAAQGRGLLVRAPLGCGCSAELRSALEPDLATFSARAGVVAHLCRGGAAVEGAAADGVGACVLLAGPRESVCASRAELGALLAYHRRAADAAACEDATDVQDGFNAGTVEVNGTVMRSLPARGRRKRSAPEAAVAEEEGAAGAAAADGDASAANPEKAAKVAKTGSVAPVGKELHQYEYMDHTADVILHSWGTSLREAISEVCVAFFSYMTDLDKLSMDESFEVEASGHDITDMLYHLLDEFLFHFGTEFIMCRRVEVLELDEGNLRVRARGFGEKFDLAKHTQGTEIKAITMHQMKILTPETVTTEEGVRPRTSDNMEGGKVKEGFPYECYVLVDI